MRQYYPIQIPFILSTKFKQNVSYSETILIDVADFAICFWEMEPKTRSGLSVENIILPDACVDLVVDGGTKTIGFAGMRKTEFHYQISTDSSSFGFRLKPGAFHCLTGLSAELAMDGFMQLDSFDKTFLTREFFAMQPIDQKAFLRRYILMLAKGKSPCGFMRLFHALYLNTPDNVNEICEMLNYSQKQCERLFAKHFGLTPKVVLNILRFQKALHILTSEQVSRSDILRIEGYYDQPHFNKDVKQTIGITPLELIKVCREDVDFIQ
ncbi:AraC family transcriptional regulator [Actinomycetota bacterium]|nr:AraC family transcriptional regulator [Actinomycetota bacterium]